MPTKREAIQCAATGRVLMVLPIDAEEWVASGAGVRVTDAAPDAEPKPKRKRRTKAQIAADEAAADAANAQAPQTEDDTADQE
jgi:hypothetical protein